MNKSIIYLLATFLVFNLGCNNHPIYDGESIWLLKNESKINDELEKRITEDLVENNTDTNWIEKSIVVTLNDTTILGAFAKRISKLNECFLIEYTFSKDFNKRKRISVIKNTTDSCPPFNGEAFLIVDSTEHFLLR